jgi:hypothetical protein
VIGLRVVAQAIAALFQSVRTGLVHSPAKAAELITLRIARTMMTQGALVNTIPFFPLSAG